MEWPTVLFKSSLHGHILCCCKHLWPFAVTHAVLLWNHIPRGDTSLSPIELFSGTSFPSKSHLQLLHVWGCPVFVLYPKVQDGRKLPKLSPCAQLGQFLDYSKDHPTSIGLIRNRSIGFVFPKLHVVHDDNFFFNSTFCPRHLIEVLWCEIFGCYCGNWLGLW